MQRKKLRGFHYQDQRRPSRQAPPQAVEVPTGSASGLTPEPAVEEKPKKKRKKAKTAKKKSPKAKKRKA